MMRRLVMSWILVTGMLLMLLPAPIVHADTYEPNDSIASATGITVGYSYYSYIASSSDVDYYRITPGAGTLNVSLAIPAGVDYDIQLQNSSGSTLTGGYAGAGTNESFSYAVSSGTTYYLRVYAYSGSSSSSAYTLSTSLSGGGGGGSDPYEPNDSTAAARSMTVGSSYTAYLSSTSDNDYFTFTASCTGTFALNMSVPSGVDYDVQLLDSAGTAVAGGYAGTGSNESFTYAATSGARYYVRVYPYGSVSTSSYTFSTSLTNCQATDTYEPNDSRSSAYAVSPNTNYYSKIATSGDVDFYRVTPSANSNFTFAMNVPSDKDYDVELQDGNGGVLASSGAGTGGAESMSYAMSGGTTYYIRIWGYGGAYSSTSTYNFNFSLAEQGDMFEPNNSRTSATSIGVFSSFTTLTLHASADEDYFRVSPTNSGRVKVTLIPPSGLDYDVDIQNSAGTRLGGGSSGAGVTETVYMDLTGGSTYYVRVFGFNGANSLTAYTLILDWMNAPAVQLNRTSATPLAPLEPNLGIVINNYSSGYTYTYRAVSSTETHDIETTDAGGGARYWNYRYTDFVEGGYFPVMEGSWQIEVTATNAQGLSATGRSPYMTINRYLTPVVYVPGFGGSIIDQCNTGCTDRDQLWWPEGNWDTLKLELNQNGTNKGGIITDVNGVILSDPTFGDYGRTTVNRLQSKGYIQYETLFLFDYDWRKDIAVTALDLQDQVKLARLMAGSRKASIVSHSMGGVLSKYYMLALNGRYDIDAFISIGTPYLGAPVAYKAMTVGDDLGVPTAGVEEVEVVADTFPATYQMLPSSQFFSSNPSPFKGYIDVYQNSTPNWSPSSTLDYAASMSLLNQYPLQGPTGSLSNWNIASSLNQAVHTYDTSTIAGVRHHILVGTGYWTVWGMSQYRSFTDPEGISRWQIRWGEGDAVVPLFSATHNPSGGATVRYVNTDSSKTVHGQLPGHSGVADYVAAVVTGNNSPAVSTVYASQQTTPKGTGYDLFCPVDVHIYDEQGRHTGPTTDGKVDKQIPGVSYEITGDSKHWVLPTDGSYRIEFQGTGTGQADLHITQLENGRQTERSIFNKLSVTPEMRATMQAGPKNPDHVLTFKENQGAEERTLKPHATTRGADKIQYGPAPTATVKLTGAEGRQGWYTSDVTVTYAARDQGRGVVGISFKREGDDRYRAYTEPLVLTEEGVVTLLAGATDNLGIDQPTPTRTEVKIDKAAPVTTAVRSERTLTLSAIDAASGVAAIEFSTDGGVTWNPYSQALTFTDPVTVLVRATDVAGNLEEAQSVTIE